MNRVYESICASAVIVAAGSSTRAGRDKIMAEIHGVPTLVRAVSAFEKCRLIDEIVIVVSDDKIDDVSEMCRKFTFKKVRRIVRGGENRMLSSFCGVSAVSKNARYIAIHDGARPFISPELIEDVIISASQNGGAAAPFVTPKDTVKVIKDGFVVETLDRSVLRNVQTPQVFDAALIKGALTNAIEKGLQLTDDCSAVEQFGGRVFACEGEYTNIKLTTPEDFLFAELLAKEIDKNENWSRV